MHDFFSVFQVLKYRCVCNTPIVDIVSEPIPFFSSGGSRAVECETPLFFAVFGGGSFIERDAHLPPF